MNELDVAIYSRLSSATALTTFLPGTTSIYHKQAKENAALPYIVWNIQGGGDENRTPHRTKNLIVFIRAYSGVSALQAGSIDAQIDTAIHLVPFTVSGWANFWLARETDLETVVNEPSGKQVHMCGAFYRVRLEKQT